MKIACLAGAVVLAVLSPAWGQTEPTKEDPAVLGGPPVAPSADAPRLAERDYAGRVKPLEIPPEEAAIGLLNLDAEAKERVDAILIARAAIIDRVVIENIESLLELQSARAANDRETVQRVLAELVAKLGPLRERGRLVDEIAAALPEDKAAEFRSLVADYWKAVLGEEGGGRATARVRTRETLQAFGREIKRSYDRQVTARVAEFDSLLAKLGLAPEQESKIRSLVTDFGQQTKLNPSPAQQRELVEKIMIVLEPAQRREFLKAALGR